jgi:hypothetical protein
MGWRMCASKVLLVRGSGTTVEQVAHRVVWSPRAIADVEQSLAGRKVPEFEDESIRELIAYSYRIIYVVE